MNQKQVNRNIDYLYRLQINETEHQNHRLGWILTAQALIFAGLCAILTQVSSELKDYLYETIITLFLIIGVLLSISGVYSIIISRVSIGTTTKMWDMYKNHIPQKSILKI